MALPTLRLAAAAALIAAAPLSAQAQAAAPGRDMITLWDVFLDASLEVQLVFVGLVAVTVAGLAAWAMELPQIRKGRLQRTPARLAFLSAVSGAGPLFGFATAAYVLLRGSLGLANVVPTPPLSVVAPGVAEALLAVVLGLLAGAVAVALRRHLEGQLEMWRGAGAALSPAE